MTQIKRTSRRPSKFIIGALILIAIALITAVFTVNRSVDLSSAGGSLDAKIVRIEAGSTPEVIASQLEQEGLVTSADNFQKHVSNSGLGQKLKFGTYSLSESMTIDEIANIIAEGKTATKRITLVPGLSLKKIEQVLIDEGYDEQDVKAQLSATPPHPLFDRTTATSLEGYMFPETYLLDYDSTLESTIATILNQFDTAVTPAIVEGLDNQGLTLEEGVILASLVQMEIGIDPANMPQVAQVFIKRVNEGIMLGSDVTFKYAAELLGVESAIDLDSPYNTRVYAGLPPTAISNFTLAALDAVANPADTDFLFFVSGDDGNTYFANTLAEHEENAAKYCIELCQIL